MKTKPLLILGFVTLILSCQKSESPDQELPLMDESKMYFEDTYPQEVTETETSSSDKKLRQLLGRKPLWNEAYIKEISTGKAVIVPLHFSKSMYTKAGKKKQAVALDNLSYLMIYKNKSKKMTAELVTWTPDNAWWDNRKDKNRKFTGKVIVEDWKGDFIKGYKYSKGGEITPIKPSGPQSKGNETSVLSTECIDTDWYTCYGPGGWSDCHYSYTETICSYVAGGWGGDGSDGTTGGGTGPSDYPPAPGAGCPGTYSSGNSTSAAADGCDGTVPDLPAMRDIINNIKDPCLKAVVDDLINKNIAGKIGEIIAQLEGDDNVIINFVDSMYTTNNRPAMMGSIFTRGSKLVETSIILSKTALGGTTKENAATAIIHEVIHAYFAYTQKRQLGTLEHQSMANNYVAPIAVFLSEAYGISARDATALAWSGLDDAESYNSYEFFDYPGGRMTKLDQTRIYREYITNDDKLGTPICN